MPELKPVEDVVACFLDFGNFISLAEKVSSRFKKVYYHSPIEDEFRTMSRCIYGYGVPGITRLDDFMLPDFLDEIDLFIVPDIGFTGHQLTLKKMGKAVWGAMGACELELSRTRFIDVVKELDLPVVPSKRIKGLTNLAEHLKTVEDKWVKVNRFRGDMETWHHVDYAHSARMLDALAVKWGGNKEKAVFVVQDHIETEIEIGYDGWTVDGEFPVKSFSGYEKKNELYLGSLLDYDDLPKQVRQVNEAIAPLLKEYGYRNFIATELRVKDGVPYYIDPTNRLAGMTMEHQQETCTNLADVIWEGANGNLIVPEFTHKIAAEATMHYTLDTDGGCKTLSIPKSVKPFVKLDHYNQDGDIYHFPPRPSTECGVVLGFGDTIEEAVSDLKKHFKELEREPLSIDEGGFVDLISAIDAAEKAGMKFSDEVTPEPEDVVT